MKGGLPEILFLYLLCISQLIVGWQNQQEKTLMAGGALTNSEQRLQWEQMMLADPSTGLIPTNATFNENKFLERYRQHTVSRSSDYNWHALGPKNVGGRTRAIQLDVRNPQIMLAGSASGGIFRSNDGGDSWVKVTDPDHNLAITSLAQDRNSGKEDIWYACTGELRGGLQIQGNSMYSGNGILKSTDNGLSWDLLPELQNPSPQFLDSTDRAWRIIVATPNSNVYLASASGIHRSLDGGQTWTDLLGSKSVGSGFTDIVQSNNGHFYTALDGGAFNQPGLFRSTDGLNWTNIGAGNIPSNVGRMVLAVDEQFQGERIYILAVTPNQGKVGYSFQNTPEYHSLYKYTYVSGDGSGTGGLWVDLSNNIPVGPNLFDDYISQNAYCMDIAVSPYDSNIVAIGGTNLYISDDAFKTSNYTRYAGGYGETTTLPDFQVYPNHHPDLQSILFHPSNKDIMLTGSDGGIHLTNNLYDTSVVWESLNNHYKSTQFYTLAIESNSSSLKTMGGTQDNGTYLSMSGDETKDWTMPMSYDGAYCAFSDNDKFIYCSKQLDGIAKIEIDAQGNRLKWKRIDPVTTSSYLFINPYTLDPSDVNKMLLPIREELWINSDLSAFTPDNTFDRQTLNWSKIGLPTGFQPSAIAVSTEKPNPTVILASTSGSILKITDPYNNPTVTDITSTVDARGYINSLCYDPDNPNRILAVFSNYNTYSVFISENGGLKWQNISGNLEGEVPPGIPPQLKHLNDGPSCRVGKIINVHGTTTYLVGTSIGLFQTTTLDSINTVWEMIGNGSIDNAVVSDIQFRSTDGMLTVSTYGNGIFRSFLYPAGVESNDLSEGNKMTLFPNPCNREFTVRLKEFNAGNRIQIFSQDGKLVQEFIPEKENNVCDVSDLKAGSYIVQLQLNKTTTETKQLIVL